MSLRVMVVEDEECIRLLYREICRLGCHELVGEAVDGREGVERFKRMDPPPDVVIMDHRMPVKDGLDARPNEKLKGVHFAVLVFADLLLRLPLKWVQAILLHFADNLPESFS